MDNRKEVCHDLSTRSGSELACFPTSWHVGKVIDCSALWWEAKVTHRLITKLFVIKRFGLIPDQSFFGLNPAPKLTSMSSLKSLCAYDKGVAWATSVLPEKAARLIRWDTGWNQFCHQFSGFIQIVLMSPEFFNIIKVMFTSWYYSSDYEKGKKGGNEGDGLVVEGFAVQTLGPWVRMVVYQQFWPRKVERGISSEQAQ